MTTRSNLHAQQLNWAGLIGAIALFGLTVALSAQSTEAGFVGILALAALWIGFLILSRSELGLILALIVAGLLADALRTVTVAGGDSSSVKLAGIVGLGTLGLTLIALAVKYHAAGTSRVRLIYAPAPFLYFWAFLMLNLIAVGIGVYRYGVFAALTDADWLLWTGYFLLMLLLPSYNLYVRLAFALWGISIIQSAFGIGRLLAGRSTLYLSTGGDRYVPGSTSVLIAAGFVITIILLFYVVRRLRWRLALVGIAALQLGGILLSFNRQTWLGLFLALLFGFCFLFQGKRLTMAALGGVISLAVVFLVFVLEATGIAPVSITEILASRVGLGSTLQEYLREPSMLYRLSAWQVALEGIAARPLFGQGWGAPFVFAVPLARGTVIYEASPHNTYLWIAYKAGIPALAGFIAMLLTLLTASVVQFYRLRQRRSVYALLLMGAILSQIIYLFGAFWWDYLSVMYLSIPIWINIGILTALSAPTVARRGLPDARMSPASALQRSDSAPAAHPKAS